MENREILISEAKRSSSIILASVPGGIAILVTFAELSGRGLQDGIYYQAFGPLIYVVFFGGLAYASYEFSKIIRGRLRYLTYQDGSLHILEQTSVRLDQINSIAVERNLLWPSLVIKTSTKETIRIRGYLLQRDMVEVKNTIETLRASKRH